MKVLTIKKIEIIMTADEEAFRPSWGKYLTDVFTSPTICRITTEDGYVGIGGTICDSENRHDASIFEAAGFYAQGLKGKSALDREAIWTWMADRLTSVGFPAMAIVDIALWDLVGKFTKLPLYQLLGAARDKILSYASTPLLDTHEDYFNYIQECIDQGFKAIKLHVPTIYEEDAPLVDAVQNRFAGKVRFMIDIEEQYNFEEAYKMCRKLEEYDWVWAEAPLPDRDFGGYKRLVDRTVVPVLCTGNMIRSLHDINNGIKAGVWTDVRCDVTVSGGITPVKKIVSLAEANNMRIQLQSWGTTLTQAANLHMMLACNNCTYFEQAYPYENFEIGSNTVIRTDREGYVRAPEGYGLGIEMDWDEVDRLTIRKDEF